MSGWSIFAEKLLQLLRLILQRVVHCRLSLFGAVVQISSRGFCPENGWSKLSAPCLGKLPLGHQQPWILENCMKIVVIRTKKLLGKIEE